MQFPSWGTHRLNPKILTIFGALLISFSFFYKIVYESRLPNLVNISRLTEPAYSLFLSDSTDLCLII